MKVGVCSALRAARTSVALRSSRPLVGVLCGTDGGIGDDICEIDNVLCGRPRLGFDGVVSGILSSDGSVYSVMVDKEVGTLGLLADGLCMGERRLLGVTVSGSSMRNRFSDGGAAGSSTAARLRCPPLGSGAGVALSGSSMRDRFSAGGAAGSSSAARLRKVGIYPPSDEKIRRIEEGVWTAGLSFSSSTGGGASLRTGVATSAGRSGGDGAVAAGSCVSFSYIYDQRK